MTQPLKEKNNFHLITVTIERQYIVPVNTDGITTQVNGWTITEVVQDWFNGLMNINAHHASRDYHHVPVDKIVGIKIHPLNDLSAFPHK